MRTEESSSPSPLSKTEKGYEATVRQALSEQAAPETPRELSRRGFLQACAGTSFALALGGLFGCAPRSEVERNADGRIIETIDCDVLVIGGGGAGVTAAGQAAAGGAKTILAEKLDGLMGSSSLAIGTLYGAGTTLQKAAGIEDEPSGLLSYFLTRGGDKLDYEMQRFCAEHFGETIDWLVNEIGVPFKETISKKGTDPVPRGHNIDDRASVALQAMYSFAQAQGAEFHFRTAAESLIVNDSGAVTGIIAQRGSCANSCERVCYNAKKIIIASGGFCRNPEMIDLYCPDYSGVYTEVGSGCTGEGLQMGLDIGADYVGHGGTNGILACAVSAGQSKLISKEALWLDRTGTRFANEGGQTHDIYYMVSHFDDQSFYAVYDQAMVDKLDENLRRSFDLGLELGIFTTGATVAEAAKQLDINGDAAQAALSAYNKMAAAGADSQFKKKPEFLIPLTQAPFYVLTMGVCTHGSFGGYSVDTQFRVLDTQRRPIANLYAAGEVCCGSFIYDDYPAGGCGLNFSYTSGRFSGANAAEAALV
jgi:succinate dehydrogenase/fumarate reductase flavoprotein subunit